MEGREPKPAIPASGDQGRYTIASGRAAVARVGWHLPDPDVRPDIAVRFSLADCNRTISLSVLRLNEPVVSESFDEAEHPLTGFAIDDFATAALAAIGQRAF